MMSDAESVFDERADWLEHRRGGIGGTDISAILGRNPWKGPLDVYLSKVGREERERPTHAMTWGLRLEQPISDAYQEETGHAVARGAEAVRLLIGDHPVAEELPRFGVIDGQPTARHAIYHFAVGSPDGLVIGVRKGLEIKTAAYQSQEWGRPGTDQVPIHYLLQCAWYMAITGQDAWDLAVLFSGNRLLLYTVERNQELERSLLDAAEEFWTRHVEARVEPEIDASATWARHLARRFGAGNETILDASDDGTRWAAALRAAQRARAEAEVAEQLARNQLMALIGEAKGMKGGFGRVTWVRPRPSLSTDWEALARTFEPPPEQVARFTEERPRAAYLKFTPAKEKETAA